MLAYLCSYYCMIFVVNLSLVDVYSSVWPAQCIHILIGGVQNILFEKKEKQGKTSFHRKKRILSLQFSKALRKRIENINNYSKFRR